MQIGFNLPISGPLFSPEILTRIAQEGEALGYDYLTLTDHIVLPNLRVPGYPYSESGEFFSEGPERRSFIRRSPGSRRFCGQDRSFGQR